jgi:hypothetical protein
MGDDESMVKGGSWKDYFELISRSKCSTRWAINAALLTNRCSWFFFLKKPLTVVRPAGSVLPTLRLKLEINARNPGRRQMG